MSLVAPGELPATPAGIELERHLRVEIHDISEPLDGHILPEVEHLAQVIEFLRAWSHADGALLVHCVAGISRSMAVALIALVVKAGGRELEAARSCARRRRTPGRTRGWSRSPTRSWAAKGGWSPRARRWGRRADPADAARATAAPGLTSSDGAIAVRAPRRAMEGAGDEAARGQGA